MAPPKNKPMTMAEFAADIADIGDMVPSINVFLHGPPGSGKTTLAASLPDSFMLACDPGWVTARSRGFKTQARRVPDYETAIAGIHWLEDGGHANYRYIIADGLNVFQTRLTQQFGREAYEVNPAKRVSPEHPDRTDYFRAQTVLKNVVGRLCDLPLPVIFTAHSTTGEDQAGETWIRPHVEGREYQVGNFVCGMMTCIGYMQKTSVGKGAERRQVTRILWDQFHDDNNDVHYLAKDQLGVFPQWTDDLSAADFDRYIIGGEAGATPATPSKATKSTRSRGRAAAA